MNLNNADDIRIPIIAGTLLFLCLAGFIILFIRVYYKSRIKFEVERELLKSNLLQVESEIREQTLTLVSRELHDNLGQIASLIKINLNLLSSNFSARDKIKIDESLDLLKQMISDIKALAITLNSESIVRIGLRDSLLNLASSINKTNTLKLEIDAGDLLPVFSPEVDLYLYRMCQEVINNALKHANANTLVIKMQKQKKHFTISLQDNGSGFDTKVLDDPTKINSSGLLNLAARCKLIGAELSIDSKPTKGTRIKITLATD